VGTSVLGQVVAAGELLAALVALERLVLSVERAVVTLEMLLATEPARAECADEGLGRIFGQRLLATAAVHRDRGALGVGQSSVGRGRRHRVRLGGAAIVIDVGGLPG
jgi:hypothetical protein